MSSPRAWRHLARVVLELTTPMHLGAGREGERADAEIARDANGLPTIPGSSLAGALRASLASIQPDGSFLADEIFGFQRSRKAGSLAPADARGSSLTVSWACIHDSNNVPVEGIAERARLADDQVLQSALSPTIRDHVRISHLGAADARESQERDKSSQGVGGHGKFDEMAACAGHRFTFEMELAGDTGSVESWNLLLDVLRDPALRLGAKTRRGFGAFKIVSLSGASLCLEKEEDFSGYSCHPVALSEPSPVLKALELGSVGRQGSSAIEAILELEPEGYWMFGGGDPSGFEGDADRAPVRDKRVVWADGRDSVIDDVIVIPGSSVKGALAHRVAFHCNRLAGRHADTLDHERLSEVTGSQNEAVEEIFGSVKGEETGNKGLVQIDDILMDVKPESQLVHHVSLDRFTGGARAGFLFSERPLWGGRVYLSIRIASSGSRKVSHASRKALESAIEDLAQGRLQIGAGSGRGLGYFTAKDGVKWSDGGCWINGGEK